MAHIAGPFRATFTPAVTLLEKGKRSDAKLTTGASLVGVKWAVTVTRAAPAGASTCLREGDPEVILKLPATEQPLADLHRGLTPLAGGDHHAIWLTTEIKARELSRAGKPTKRFRPLFPSLKVHLRFLKGREIRSPYGSLPGEIMKLMSVPMPSPHRQLGPRVRLSAEEHRERQLKVNWTADVIRDPYAFRAKQDAETEILNGKLAQLGLPPVGLTPVEKAEESGTEREA